MKRTWMLVFAAMFAAMLGLSTTGFDTSAKDNDDPRNSKDAIKKCDNELAQCKADCDKSVIDVENNLQACKKQCDNDRAACLMYRRHPNVGTTPGGAKPTPPATATTPH